MRIIIKDPPQENVLKSIDQLRTLVAEAQPTGKADEVRLRRILLLLDEALLSAGYLSK